MIMNGKKPQNEDKYQINKTTQPLIDIYKTREGSVQHFILICGLSTCQDVGLFSV